MSAAIASRVLQAIDGRERHAQEVGAELGLSHEDVYGALAWLEGQGLARIQTERPDHQSAICTWSACRFSGAELRAA